MEQTVIQKVDDYIYGRETRYSAEIIRASENKEDALKLIEHLSEAFTRRPKADDKKVNRSNLVKLAIKVSENNFADDEIQQSLKSLLQKISKVAQKDYIKYSKDRDDFIVYMSKVRSEKMTDFLGEIANEHAVGLCSQLEEAAQEKYKNWVETFSKETEEKVKAENERKAQNEAKTKANKDKNQPSKQKDKTGDIIMTEDNKLTPEQIEELKKYKEIAEVTGVNLDDVTPESYKEILEVLRKADRDFVVEATASVDEGGKDNAEGNKKSINIDGENIKNEPKTIEEAPAVADWIQRKIKDYQDMADGKIEGCPKLEGYQHDDSVKNGFAASFNGGSIHYTSPDNVIVSKESGLIIFETLVTEPDNRGRPVNFGPNLDHEQSVKLLAACLIHGNEVGNNPPQLSEEDLKMLETELSGRTTVVDGKEVSLFETLKPQLKQYTFTKDDKRENTDISDDEPKAFDDETRGKIKEALDNQYKMAAIESSGKVAYSGEGKGAVIVKTEKCSDEEFAEYNKLKEKQVDDKNFLAKKFVENPEGIRALMKELVNEKINGKLSGRTEEEKNDLAAARQVQIAALRARREALAGTKEGTTQLDEHNDRTSRVAKLQEDMSIALGIKEPSEEQKNAGMKALEGEKLADYIQKNNISKFTYSRLLAMENKGKEPDKQKKADDAVLNVCKETSSLLIKAKENGGKE